MGSVGHPGRLLVACVQIGLVLGTAPVAAADELDDTVKTVRKLVRDDDFAAAQVWVAALADIRDDRVDALLRDLYRGDDDGLAIDACRLLATRKDPAFLPRLHRRALDEDFAEERPALHRETIAAIGAYASPASRKTLISVVERAFDTDQRVAIVGITSFGKIEERDVVDRLIRWLARAETAITAAGQGAAGGMTGGVGGAGGPGDGPTSRPGKRPRTGPTGGGPTGAGDAADVEPPDAARARADQIRAAILRELRRITGENHPDAPVWRKWWKEHRAGFRFS